MTEETGRKIKKKKKKSLQSKKVLDIRKTNDPVPEKNPVKEQGRLSLWLPLQIPSQLSGCKLWPPLIFMFFTCPASSPKFCLGQKPREITVPAFQTS